jgi:phage terminase large subunit-like protein
LLSIENVEDCEAFLASLDAKTLKALPWMFEFWAHEHQIPPLGDWLTWVILGGRGAGKTRAGSEWIRTQMEGATPLTAGRCRRAALIGETFDQTREIMVFGDSGILASTPADRRPVWHATRKTLIWPNGAEAKVFSAHEPENLRGPQFDCAWLDELAKWKRAKDTWDMLQFALRLGERPQQIITTTPRNVGILKKVLSAKNTVQTHAPTSANRFHLADSFLKQIEGQYGGSRLGRQEIDGEFLEDVEGALWSLSNLDQHRIDCEPELDRVVVAVDPPATSGKNADSCGIIIAGVVQNGPPQNWKAYVLADRTLANATPLAWASLVSSCFDEFKADRVVAEVNQGGEMVEAVLRQQSSLIPYRGVRATRGKIARAEPVSALYEQGRVKHLCGLSTLEDQMCEMSQAGFTGQGSPDRVDALVWALTDLMIEPAKSFSQPNIRIL